MAFLAPWPECPAVGVIGLVAGNAFLRSSNRRNSGARMAGMTFQSCVRTGQWELGLAVMIKAPKRPAVRVVAAVARRSKFALVKRILVAIRADF